MICWSKDLFERRVEELIQDLVSRGYNRTILETVIDQACKIPQSKAIEKVEQETDVQKRVQFVIKLPWTALVEDRDMKKVFTAPLMVCYKEGPEPMRDAVEGQVTDG